MPVCEEIDGEDEEIVMTVLGSNPRISRSSTCEPISIGGGDSSDSSDDDAWNSCESKEGHSLRDEIATFVQDRAIALKDARCGPGLARIPSTRSCGRQLHQAFKKKIKVLSRVTSRAC